MTRISATGMVWACIVCAHRFPRAERCPRCGAGRIYDLRLADDRLAVRSALDRIAVVPRSTTRMLAIAGGAIPLGMLLAAVAGVDAGTIGLAGFVAVVCVLVALLRVFFRGEAEDVEAESKGSLPLAPFPPALLPPADAVTVRGVVHVRRSVRSPDGAVCAAWQLVGDGPAGPLDDAGVGAFDVRAEGGGLLARVDADAALVDAGPLSAPRSTSPDGALAAILEVRGDVGDAGRCSIAFGHISEGDLVEVTGPASREVTVEGLRESSTIPVMRVWPTIRKLA